MNRTGLCLFLLILVLASGGCATPTPQPAPTISLIEIVTFTEEPTASEPSTPEPTLTPSSTPDPNATRPCGHPDGCILFTQYVGENDPDIYLIDPDGANKTCLTCDMELYAASVSSDAWSPDGSRFVFSAVKDGNIELFTANYDGSNLTRLTQSIPTSDGFGHWSPDGQHIVYESSSDVYVTDPDGLNSICISCITPDLIWGSWPQWLPDGRRLSFSGTAHDGETNTDITNTYVINVDGSNLQCLTCGEDIPYTSFTIGPDGQQIVYTLDVEADHSNVMYAGNINGGTPICLTCGMQGDEWDAVWSPDGKRIMFFSRPEGFEAYIYLIDPDGSNLTWLTVNNAWYLHLAWSSDGKHIAMTNSRYSTEQPEDLEELYVMEADGSGLRCLTCNELGYRIGFPQWRPMKPSAGASPPEASTPTPTAVFSGVGIKSNAEWTPTIRDFDGVPMALVPAGCFWQGLEIGDTAELPAHEVCIEEPFWIDVTEVSKGQFRDFEGAARLPATTLGMDMPRDNVTWLEAEAFCMERGGRLPTETEWEYAARGPDGLIFPWGNKFISENVTWGTAGPTPVGSKPGGASWVGALDMSGNLWEWIHDGSDTYYMPDTPPTSTPISEWECACSSNRVIRGGSYIQPPASLRTTYSKWWFSDEYADYTIGFRCARSDE